jgi:dihydroorotase
MLLLIKNAKIIYTPNIFSLTKKDILVENGIIKKIADNIANATATIFDAKGAALSIGFMDIGTQVGDPGFEHREDAETAAAAAASGGFTAIAMQPNTSPTMDTKANIAYIQRKTDHFLVDFHVIGALSQDCKGENICEMYELHESGAVGFSDGKKSIHSSGLMLRALQYVKAFDGLIINQPLEKGIAAGGQMHEGVMSTSLGMKGIPSLAEEMMLARDIYLLEYAESRLHVQNISTARSVTLIREAKAKGLQITAAVPALNLAFDDDALVNFDTFLKVMPPLRSQSDMEALREGLQDGTIDIITSNHVPLDEEAWNLEFPYADFGAIGLETAVSVAHTFGRLSVEELVEKFAIAPRKILRQSIPMIAEGEKANFTIFDPHHHFTFEAKDIRSRSKNSPLLGKKLRGKVMAVCNNGQFLRFD